MEGVELIEVDRKVARDQVREYRKMAREEMTEEDRKILAAYRHVERGRKLINIRQAIGDTGLNDKREPKLAICRADSKTCFAHVSSYGNAIFSMKPVSAYRRLGKKWGFTFDEIFPRRTGAASYRDVTLTGVVPIIPPQFRPPKSKLHLFHILWEADWKRVPVDPFLLKHVRGDLYAVCAMWDLTAVERAVLTGRAVQ